MSIPQADVMLTFITRRQQLKDKLYMALVTQCNITRNTNIVHYYKSLCWLGPKIQHFSAATDSKVYMNRYGKICRS
jgi:hypothetical protein